MDKRLRFMTDLTEPLLVTPGSTVKLSRDHDPGYTGPVTRPEAAVLLAEGVEVLAEYQAQMAQVRAELAAELGLTGRD